MWSVGQALDSMCHARVGCSVHVATRVERAQAPRLRGCACLCSRARPCHSVTDVQSAGAALSCPLVCLRAAVRTFNRTRDRRTRVASRPRREVQQRNKWQQREFSHRVPSVCFARKSSMSHWVGGYKVQHLPPIKSGRQRLLSYSAGLSFLSSFFFFFFLFLSYNLSLKPSETLRKPSETNPYNEPSRNPCTKPRDRNGTHETRTSWKTHRDDEIILV